MYKSLALLGLAVPGLASTLMARPISGGFSGAYSVGSSGSYSLTSTPTTFGNWTGVLATSGGGSNSASLDTTSAPASLTLSATGGAGVGGVGQGTATFNFSLAPLTNSGLISFSVSSTTGLSVYLDSTLETPTGTSYSFSAASGQTLEFSVTATGTPGMVMLMPPMMTPFPVPGSVVTNTVTITNFVAPVPEPATYAAIAGGAMLLVAGVWRRRQTARAALAA